MEENQKQELADLAAQLPEMVRKQVDEALKAKTDADRDRLLREALGVAEDAGVEAMIEGARKLAAQNGNAAELREALGLDADADPIAEARRIIEEKRQLEAEKRRREVAAFVEADVAKIKDYPERLQVSLREAVQADAPDTLEEAEAAIAKHRKVFDPLVADILLEKKGMSRGVGHLKVIGSVLENETGTPEYARVAHQLTESLAKRSGRPARTKDRSYKELAPSERFTRRYLEAYDARYQQWLVEEARRFDEAMDTTGLYLPYTVNRAVIMEAFPELVAPNVFDVNIANALDTRLVYETYADESGATAAITDEDVIITALDTWIDMAHGRIQFGTVVVEPNGGGPALVEGTDYVVDYANGKLLATTAGSMTASPTTYDVDYTYDAIRKGEGVAIERGEQTTASKTITLAADRLAAQITDEAIKFSRSQLDYDAVVRAIAGIVGRVQRKIDKDIFYAALGAAMTVASNSGGTWSSTVPGDSTYQEHLDLLLRYIGAAKILVANRSYTPTAIVASIANADVLGNSEKWNRPDTDVQANGYMGRVKGLPIWAVETEQFTDGYIMVVNRELVMHRTNGDMEMKGPFPVYSSAKMVAAEEYYIQQYNATEAPVPQKGAYVKIS